MALIIAGHQRSGTSMLQVLINHHPQIGMTMELANFMKVGAPFNDYVRFMLWRWSDLHRRKNPLVPPRQKKEWQTQLANNRFVAAYLWHLYRHRQPVVDARLINTVLHKLFPEAVLVGDKYPDYIYQMDLLAAQQELKNVVIYRDVRDVVSSTLKKVRTDWQGLEFAQKMDSAEKVAGRWVEAVTIMEQQRDRIYCLRYEDLVASPASELAQLGEWLGVRPDGFPAKWVKSSSVGKHQSNLTALELQAVLDVAGPAMKALGYPY